jgi:4-amino-4-deoxy-L-arabinose transferase-like glycosyltransferase
MLEKTESNKYLVALICILAVPALLINLEIMPTLGDEATRALVALEFILRKNYIFSTINGEPYYNKPPLYNWLLVLLFNTSGRADEWILRLPAVVSLLAFCVVIYFTMKKHVENKIALLTAFAFLTFGRMLFYDSMLGHIDILFSLILYLAIYSVFYFIVKERYFLLFPAAYFLTSLAFLMKGLPALVFLGLSLCITFFSFKKLKGLFHPAHFSGIAIFLLIIGGYFLIYNKYNSSDDFLKTLWSESSKRTAFENNWKSSLSFLFIFPFEYLFHLMPWSLLIVTCFRKDFFNIAQNNPFILFCLIILAINIPIYWISPETRPRYLFLLFPFIFVVLIYFYFKEGAERQKFITSTLLSVAFIVFVVMACFPFFVEIHAPISFKNLKALVLLILLTGITFLFFKSDRKNLFYLPLALLIARIGFDLFVLPERATVSPEIKWKEAAIASAKISNNLPLYIYKSSFMKHNLSYYYTIQNNKMLVRDFVGKRKDVYYVMESFYFQEQPFKKLFEFQYDGRQYFIVKSE